MINSLRPRMKKLSELKFRMVRSLLLFILIMTSNNLYAQSISTDSPPEFFEKMIEGAIESLSNEISNFDPDLFDRARVMSEGGPLVVEFVMSVQYIPLNSSGIYWIQAKGRGGSFSIEEYKNGAVEDYNIDPFDLHLNFYTRKKEHQKHIDFVLDALDEPVDLSTDIIIIEENEDRYRVKLNKPSHQVDCEVLRKTGEMVEKNISMSHNNKAFTILYDTSIP